MCYKELWQCLTKVYDEGEAKAIARMAYEERFGLTLSDIYLGKDTQLSADDQTELEEIAMRLLQGEPIQYVLGHADFCGRTFLVNEHVLIPRPETEELCQWESLPLPSPKGEGAKILDIGTGSGCIAITLAAMYPEAEVTAWDISAEALEVARNVKEVREQVNRLVNCETANLQKTVDAAGRQLELIRQLSARGSLASLPPKLRAAAEARLARPEASLNELAEELGISKSGMNHRLRKLKEIAER